LKIDRLIQLKSGFNRHTEMANQNVTFELERGHSAFDTYVLKKGEEHLGFIALDHHNDNILNMEIYPGHQEQGYEKTMLRGIAKEHGCPKVCMGANAAGFNEQALLEAGYKKQTTGTLFGFIPYTLPQSIYCHHK
jgi:hypothetical protein